MGTILRGLQRVPWGDLQVPRGSAKSIPALLSKTAWSDRETASLALDDLTDLVCELGFVISEATAPTVPFLIELAGAPQVMCKVEVLELLRKIFTGRQWTAASEAFSTPREIHLAQQVGWERAAQEAVAAGRSVFEGMTESIDPDVADAATKLVQAIEAEAKH